MNTLVQPWIGRIARPAQRGPWVLAALGFALLLSLLWASGQGAYGLPLRDLPAVLASAFNASTDPRSGAELVFFNIRLPRLVLGVAAGAGLGLAGALMQGLFRNPLADPGLIGVSSGAALAAGATIVLGATWFPDLPRALGSWPLVAMAFAGGLGVSALIYALSISEGGTRVGLMLLAGIAVNALAGAGLGLLNFLATDEQLRNLQFWLLGSLGGARWSAVLLVSGLTVAALLIGLRQARALNALALGEAQAVMLGVPVERLKRLCVGVTALAVGAITATTGIIGFIGLVAPHIVRLLAGPDHRWVLPGSALLGAALVLLADAFARTVLAPAELPLGVITALVGVPFFLALLRGAHARSL
ncbi:MAG: iron ABC transporter permease [Hydrogenophaga sp.]|uniref:FecCD family ABC transporter permease n=1 Tax=Hydrogenophaga sp. TaxID=1904254 RepID=UPI001DC96BEF|nr:iron ABC transporter permease [Hydrogenophaga sp.]MBX3608500.1 iron ABC transporter permease [Hydrogenophaga sp.]